MKRLPVLQGILPIRAAMLPGEIMAGLTLAALAIPEVMGYTRIAGTPVITGLYTILIPMALFALFGSSRHLVVGADSATAAILATALAGMATIGSEEYVALAGVLAILAAGFLLLARIVKLGFLSDFLSRTVLIGFLTGVGVQVALGQIGGMLGMKGGGHGTLAKIWNDLQQLDHVNFYAVGISATVLATILGLRLVSKKIPGPLIAVIGAVVASWGLGLSEHVHVLGAIPSGLPKLQLPQIVPSLEVLSKLVPTAFAMFVVILTQSAATSRAYAARYDENFNADTDLVGLMLANLGAGLSGTFVVNGSPTKTEMVDQAGGRSQLSQLVTVGVVLLVILFLTRFLTYMPDAVLSAVVFLIGISLIDVPGMVRIFRQRKPEFWVAVITAVTVLFLGVEHGIVLAVILSLVVHTRHGYRPKNAVLVPTEAGTWRSQPVSHAVEALPGLLVYRFNHSMYYANVQQLLDEVNSLTHAFRTPPRWFCIDADAVDDIDFTAAATLRSIQADLNSRDIRLVVATDLSEMNRRVHQQWRELLKEDQLFDSLDVVLESFQQVARPSDDTA